MVLKAVRGAIGFLSTLPVGHDDRTWEAFRSTPVAFPIAGYLLGMVILVPLLLPIPAATAAIVFLVWIYVVTGINHLDGLADLGDAFAAHGDATERRTIMRDTDVGVGAVAAVAIVVFGVGLAGFSLAGATLTLLAVVIAAEVGAKLAMVIVMAVGTPAHEGIGSEFVDGLEPRGLLLPVGVALPVGLLTAPHPAAMITLFCALLPAVAILWWSQRSLGGVSGDVLGATNELGRLIGLHSGVITWMLW